MTAVELQKGDLVEVVNGERVHRGRVEIWISGTVSNPSLRPHLADCNEPAFLDNAEGWTITVIEKAEPPIVLPTEPGTVIAIGEWHLVKLRPYNDNVAAAWEMLPAPEDMKTALASAGVSDQCVYGNEWVQAQAEEIGGFEIVAEPRATTAKSVLEAVNRIGFIDGDSAINLRHGLANVAAEFGVRL